MDTKVRKLITCHRMHHPKADIEPLFINRENIGRSLIQLELIDETIILELKK